MEPRLGNKISYSLQHAQATAMVHPLHTITGGSLVASRTNAIKDYKQYNPDATIYKIPKYLFRLSKSYQALLDAKVLVKTVANKVDIPLAHLKKAMIFHGTFRMPIDTDFINEMNNYDLLLLNSPRQEKIFDRVKSKLQCKYQAIGYIPFEYFPKSTIENKIAIKKKYGLALNAPTIVYTPARRLVGSWLQHALAIATQTPKQMNLILRPHPNQIYSKKPDEKFIYKQILQYTKNRPYLILDLGIARFPELLCIADLLISDTTSPTEESLFYDVPQLLTDANSKIEAEKKCHAFNMHPDDIKHLLAIYNCGPTYTKDKYANWTQAIEETLATADRYKAIRAEYFYTTFANKRDGIAKAGANALSELL